MAPVDAAQTTIGRVPPTLLPQSIGQKKGDDQKGQHEKCAQYQTLDHDTLPCVAAIRDNAIHAYASADSECVIGTGHARVVQRSAPATSLLHRRSFARRPPCRSQNAHTDEHRAACAIDDALDAAAANRLTRVCSQQRIAQRVNRRQRDERRLEKRHLWPERRLHIDKLRHECDEEHDAFRIKRCHRIGVSKDFA